MNEALTSNPELKPGRRALLIVNAGSRQGASDLEPLIQRLQERDIDVIERRTGSAQQSRDEIDKLSGELDLVIVAGGDGTIHSCAEALYRRGLPLAILPLGTANDLARSLSLPSELEDIVELIADNQQRLIDLGVVNGQLFFNAVNIGLGTEITHHLSSETKKTWGVLSYFKAFWEALSRKRTFRCKITVDGRRYNGRSIHITVGNGRFYGGGTVVDEKADISSGKLYLYSIKPRSVPGLLMLAPRLRFGKHDSSPATFSTTGKHISIATSKRLEVHADGEVIDHTPVVIEVLHQALSVYAPTIADNTPEVAEPATKGPRRSDDAA